MIGRRIPFDVPRFRDNTLLERPGDYTGPTKGWTGDALAVFFLLPTANPDDPLWGGGPCDGLHHVCSPPHTFRECDDGSLEIRASIGAFDHSAGTEYAWHGFLDEGHSWRTC